MWYIKCYLYYICDFYRCSTLSLPQLFFYLCRILLGSGAAQWILQGPYQHPKAKEFVKKVPITGFSVVSNLAINGILLYIAMKLFYWLLCFLFGSCISGNQFRQGYLFMLELSYLSKNMMQTFQWVTIFLLLELIP